VQLSKQYYNKSIVLANYTRAIAEMTQVITSGKTILEEPIPASRNASLFAEAKKIVDFEKVLSDHMPEPDQLSNITVWLQHDYIPSCIDCIGQVC
jgi:endothelin-converting enzyme